ncbi:uncharacterized protein LOC113332868 [Papaver somniferum]|uniref:uncharacterized protein LOC113332868 n=1 Tax=Papaver somniferum TaxID=3469 RepID=UPI000E6F51CE|nr:uncharacterized protein LOC113332868 [Papaver somniferum]
MVLDKKIQPMVIRNGIHPTHLLFADDIFLFCNGGLKSIENLKILLMEYQAATGHIMNAAKSKFFVDGTYNNRKRFIADFFQMSLSIFPDKHLGVILVQGKVKTIHLWHILEYMHMRLAAWSVKLLNFQDNICVSKEEGGLGIRKMEDVNKASLMKFLWKILHSKEEWAKFFLDKYLYKNGNWINYYKRSSVWPGIKWVIPEFKENTRWIVGTGENISLWNDKWVFEEPLCQLFPSHPYIADHPYMKVQDLILNGQWQIPEVFLQFFTGEQLPVIKGGEDMLIWCSSHTGQFTVDDAVKKISNHLPKLHWYKKIWNPEVLPSTSAKIWKITRGACATDENLRKRGWNTASEDQVLIFFLIQKRRIHRIRIIELYFHFPQEGELLLCCGGASIGNPSLAGYGFVVRDHSGAFIFGESGGLGVATNYVAEFFASIRALEWASHNHKTKLVLQSDSKACITSLINHNIPWFLLARWHRVISGLSVTYRHVYREINNAADNFAKKGSHLQKGKTLSFNKKPGNLCLEYPNTIYYRFV